MENNDMSDIFQKMNEMLKNNQIPDNIKSMMENFASNSNNSSTNETTDTRSNSSVENDINTLKGDTSSSFPDFDISTMLKMKSIIDSMNKPQNDPRANLLKSLKPYLKTSRKDKVDQYIRLFGMGKVFEAMNPLGGEKKNDV